MTEITMENIEAKMFEYKYWIKSIDPDRQYSDFPVDTHKWSKAVRILAERNTVKRGKMKCFTIITPEQLLKYLNKDKLKKHGTYIRKSERQ